MGHRGADSPLHKPDRKRARKRRMKVRLLPAKGMCEEEGGPFCELICRLTLDALVLIRILTSPTSVAQGLDHEIPQVV